MAKSNYLKEMKGKHLNDSGRHAKVKRERHGANFRLIVDIDPKDKSKFRGLFHDELRYYNNLVEAFSAMSRAFPEKYLEISDNQEKLLGEIAYENFNPRKLTFKTDVELPKRLQPFEDILIGKDSKGQRFLTERLMTFLENPIIPANIHPQVKKNMTLEIFRFYRDQARLRMQKVPLNQQDEFMYRTTPNELEKLDSIRKRHVQVPKTICEVKWDETNEQSKVWTPYNSKPICFSGINLNEEQWTMMIIHQEPGNIPRSDTPWVADIKSLPAGYLVKYLDLTNPYAGTTFHAEKKRSF